MVNKTMHINLFGRLLPLSLFKGVYWRAGKALCHDENCFNFCLLMLELEVMGIGQFSNFSAFLRLYW